MNENKLLRGLPNGGAVILWRKNINHKVVPVEYDSDRTCAVTVHIDEGILLLVCVYMPCDDRRPNNNLLEYIQVLNDIEVVCNMVDANFVCIGGGGGLNTDLTRGSYQTKELVKFVDYQSLCPCVNDHCSNVVYTYCSRGIGATSLIDHFIISENALPSLLHYETVDAASNFSEHLTVRCVLDYTVGYMCNSRPKTSLPVDKPAWHKETDEDLFKYKEYVAFNLDRIQLPDGALICEDKHCQSHIDHLNKFHDDIIFALLEAGDKALPIARPVVSKVMPGWNN